MCLLFFETKEDPAPDEYQLVLANVRDEYYSRRTAVADFWEEEPSVIGGKQLRYQSSTKPSKLDLQDAIANATAHFTQMYNSRRERCVGSVVSLPRRPARAKGYFYCSHATRSASARRFVAPVPTFMFAGAIFRRAAERGLRNAVLQ